MNLGYEFARLGLRVLMVDTDGGGGTSSWLGQYVYGGDASIAEMVLGEAPLTVYNPANWTPSTETPWIEGGAVREGGLIHVLPATESEVKDRKNIQDILGQGGTVEERRLEKLLDNPVVQKNYDIVLVDMPGNPSSPMVSSILYAVEHVVFPGIPEHNMWEGMRQIETAIANWFEAAYLPINYIGVVPTSLPTRMPPGSAARFELEKYISWIEEKSEGTVHVLYPGIERRGVFSKALNFAQPAVTLTGNKKELRDIGNIPAQLTHTALIVLDSMRPDPTNPDTNDRVDYPVEELTELVLAQDMPDEWREIIAGPRYYDPLPNDEEGKDMEKNEEYEL